MSETSNEALIYYVNFILRNVIPCTRIGHIHDGDGLTRWLIKNGFSRVFDLTTQQLSKSDLSSLSINTQDPPDIVVGKNPFKDAEAAKISDIMSIINMGREGAILAIPTGDHSEVVPTVVYSVRQWMGILSRIGNVIEIYHCSAYSLFLVTKHGYSRSQ